MKNYTLPERINILKTFYENHGSICDTLQTLRERFHTSEIPGKSTIYKLVTKFETWGTVAERNDNIIIILKSSSMRGASQTMVQYRKQEKQKNPPNKLGVKQFVHRNSLLTDLFENKHIKGIHHMFVAIFIGLLVNTIIRDYSNYGKITTGFRLIRISFSQLHIALITWILQFTCTWISFVCFKIWAKMRTKFNPKSKSKVIWDFSWSAVALLYYFLTHVVASFVITHYELPVATSAIVTMETVRMAMKVHSFIRENASKVLIYKPHSDKALSLPGFSHYLYFLFAPTLIYRDQYPRTATIRWGFVFGNLFEVILCIFSFSLVYENLIIPIFGDFGLTTVTLLEVFFNISQACLANLLLMVLTFYLFLHCWLNMFAEMLKFGDRHFYSDWWTVSSYGDYFRKWNVVVGDWLYAYIYKDMYEIIVPKNKIAAKTLVFVISAISHEWVVTYMCRFFFPFLFVVFLAIGTTLSYVRPPQTKIYNILFWYGSSFGISLVTSVYTLEYMARINSPIENPSFKDFSIPRCFSVIKI